MCKLHPSEEVKAFCKNDLCSICFKCLLGEHRSHDIVMIEDLTFDDLSDKMQEFTDKVDDQIGKLQCITEKVASVKENYDKKFEGLLEKFKQIEEQFISGQFEDRILGELKNSKEKQREIVARVSQII